MYRNNRRNFRCACAFNSANIIQKEMLEEKCNEVPNTIPTYDACSCGFDEEDEIFPMNPLLAQSYVPWQTMKETFNPCAGLEMGTIFPELVSPYSPGQSSEFNEFVANSNTIKEGCNR